MGQTSIITVFGNLFQDSSIYKKYILYKASDVILKDLDLKNYTYYVKIKIYIKMLYIFQKNKAYPF